MLLTANEERNLHRALASLPSGIRILVLDACSTDGTAAIALQFGARVVEREWRDFVDARKFALSLVTTPWAFALDADEALDERLRSALDSIDERHGGYIVRRSTKFAGKAMRLWSNEPLLRCFRVDSVDIEAHPSVGGSAQLHERYLCLGSVGELAGTLEHFSYVDRRQYREKFTRYTSIEAAGFTPSFARLMRETIAVPWRLIKFGLLRGALLDGPTGWYVLWWSALYPLVVAWRAWRA